MPTNAVDPHVSEAPTACFKSLVAAHRAERLDNGHQSQGFHTLPLQRWLLSSKQRALCRNCKE